MSIEAVRQFSQIAEDNLEIKKSLESATDLESLINLAVELGSQRDFSFTVKDVETYYSEESINAKRVIPKATKLLTSSMREDAPTPSPCSGLPYLAREMCLKLNQ
jgi:hypothetical protein